MVVAAMKHMALNFAKLDKFKVMDFRRWQKKVHFFLSSLSVVYVLTTPFFENDENATVDQIRRRNKWDNNDYVCRGLILKGTRDEFYDQHSYCFNVENDPKIFDEAIKSQCVAFWKEMVNTRIDAELLAAVQNALQTLLPQIRAEIREEFRTSSRPSDSGGNPPPVTIHTWLERFNKKKPRLFEKATAPVDVEN
nr:zinc finger, CCHC-type [Tanacetum cinerariifolium]GEZ42306.1 zinc finger, CCHC-type [Tanacetum cinerariifolium]